MNKARPKNAHLKSSASRQQEDLGEGVLSSMRKRPGKLLEGRSLGSTALQGGEEKQQRGTWTLSSHESRKRTGKGSESMWSPH